MPKAVVHVIHGYAENVGRYGNIVNELVPAGYAIFVNDHRGHGKSGGWPSAGPTCKAVAVTLRSLRVAQQGLIMLRLVQSSNLMALYKTLRG